MFLEMSSDTSMAEAVANTAMGMGSVFIILVFIMAIIYLFAFIPIIQEKQAKKNAPKPADIKPVVVEAKKAPVVSENLMNDAQLVAVITAAIHAANGNAGATSKDQLVVRSIRRAR